MEYMKFIFIFDLNRTAILSKFILILLEHQFNYTIFSQLYITLANKTILE